jgi:hypothetical protein
LFVFAASVGIAPVASAQTTASDTSRSTELFKNGKAAFAKGDMAEAERLFGQALAIRKSSDIAANLAQSELEQQKFRAAAEHFQWALANLLPSASDQQRKAVETGLARSRAEVAVLRLDIKPEGATVLVGQQNLGKSPVNGGVFVDAGEVIVSVRHDGFVPLDKRVLVPKGTEQAIEINMLAKDEPAAPSGAPGTSGPQGVDSGLMPPGQLGTAPPSADQGTHKSLTPAFIASGVAVVGVVAGVVLTVSAGSKKSDADGMLKAINDAGAQDGLDSPCDGTHSEFASRCADLHDKRQSVDTLRNLGVGSFVVGGVATLAAGYFFWDALAHRSATAQNAQSGRRWAVLPRVDWAQKPDGRGAVDAVQLSVSGKF